MVAFSNNSQLLQTWVFGKFLWGVKQSNERTDTICQRQDYLAYSGGPALATWTWIRAKAFPIACLLPTYYILTVQTSCLYEYVHLCFPRCVSLTVIVYFIAYNAIFLNLFLGAIIWYIVNHTIKLYCPKTFYYWKQIY